MDKQLESSEIPSLIEKLSKDRRNLFFINNLQLYKLGMEIKVYKVDNAYILNWLNTSILIYAPEGYDKNEVLSFLKTQEFIAINGAREYIGPLENDIKDEFSISYRDFMMVDKSSFKKLASRDIRLRELFAPEDYEALYDLYMNIPAYKDDYPNDDIYREDWALAKAEMEYPTTGVGLYLGKRLVSGAYLSAATISSAMIVGVGTNPDYENMGFATSVVSELVDIALNENKIGYLCLWYSDEKSYHIYRKLGFKKIGEYAYFKRKAEL